MDEIEKMFIAGILDMSVNFEDKGVPQGSVIFLFLFNIYMNELDLFMERLIKKEYCPPTPQKEAWKSYAGKDYTKKVSEFSVKCIMTFIKLYNTADEMYNAMTHIKKEH